MSTLAARNELIEWIKSLDDPGLLSTLLGIKKAMQQKDRSEDLSADERRSIERGLEDLRKGRCISSADFWAGHGR
ncbi:MAG: hypothetical protein IT228_09095 [Flavobacteriales bacterium]|nr:hypothetical protein [Flavobacteriales bacterium]MCC6577482.1 hypothetical protein [Flavobacteriales bacterium]NUQ14230.1 hypothetical protein [Flavobacteriales bacterium]